MAKPATAKSPLNFWQLWNMSFGFFGIQFGWGLQMANTSAIFEYLGAQSDQLPLLWLAAPMTGLLVQPIVGTLSDNTWGPLGRRRPYFLVGAILSSLALVAMPNCSSLWMAAGLLWVLDSSINISMEPFRAFVGDVLPDQQRTAGFAMQSLFIGLGAVTASALPWILSHGLSLPLGAFSQADIAPDATPIVPLSVTWSFYLGAVVFLGAVVWTVVTTREYPPEDLEAFRQSQAQRSAWTIVQEIWTALGEMPLVMRQLAWVQVFTWMGLFCLFLYFPPAVARNIFGATDQNSPLYTQGIEWAGLCIATYNAVCFVFAFVLPKLAAYLGRRNTHSLCLLCGALGLVSLEFVPGPRWILLSMVGMGITWASVLAIPYALLIGVLPPQKTGIYMGIFNFFIVLPEILISLGLGWVMDHWLGGNRLSAIVLGGGFLVVAALVTQRVEVVEEFEAYEAELKREEL